MFITTIKDILKIIYCIGDQLIIDDWEYIVHTCKQNEQRVASAKSLISLG